MVLALGSRIGRPLDTPWVFFVKGKTEFDWGEGQALTLGHHPQLCLLFRQLLQSDSRQQAFLLLAMSMMSSTTLMLCCCSIVIC